VRRLFTAALVAAAYVVAGRLGQILAIPPGNVTAVWPPSGIALAAVLLAGRPGLAGVALGSLAVNLWAFARQGAGGQALWVATAAGMAVGAAIQASGGARLVRGAVDPDLPLARVPDVFRFVALGALLACVAAPTVGTSALCLSGLVAWRDYPVTWWTWWLGDTVGVILFAPLIIAGPAWWRARDRAHFAPLLASGVAVAASLLTLVAAARGESGLVAEAGPAGSRLLLLQGTLGAAAVGLLVLAASVAERVNVGGARQLPVGDGRPVSIALVVVTGATMSVVLALGVRHATFGISALAWQPGAVLGVGLFLTALQSAHLASSGRKTLEIERALRELATAQAQLVQAEKLASLGQMVAGVAHEINNPINFVSGAAAGLERKLEELSAFLFQLMDDADASGDVGREIRARIDGLRDSLRPIGNGVERVKRIVSSLRTFSRLDQAEWKAVDLLDGMESTIEILGIRLRDVELVRDLQPLPLVDCNAGQIHQVILNLLVNAADATRARPGGKGTVTVRSRATATHVEIGVEDNGIGIPARNLGKIFEPFFTTKPVGEGTGLGLSISYAIVQAHHGRLEVDSSEGVGTKFRIVLPIAVS
jgi:signal transduction histidine kinase